MHRALLGFKIIVHIVRRAFRQSHAVFITSCGTLYTLMHVGLYSFDRARYIYKMTAGGVRSLAHDPEGEISTCSACSSSPTHRARSRPKTSRQYSTAIFGVCKRRPDGTVP